MKEELKLYCFGKMDKVEHYDPDHKIHTFYMKERKRGYNHKSLGDEEMLRNVSSEAEVKRIHA